MPFLSMLFKFTFKEKEPPSFFSFLIVHIIIVLPPVPFFGLFFPPFSAFLRLDLLSALFILSFPGPVHVSLRSSHNRTVGVFLTRRNVLYVLSCTFLLRIFGAHYMFLLWCLVDLSPPLIFHVSFQRTLTPYNILFLFH